MEGESQFRTRWWTEEGVYYEKIGDILVKLLPAGSISGTPKKKTVELIEEIENYERGFISC